MSYRRYSGYDPLGYYGLPPEPCHEPVDPQLGVTAADVVATVAQQLEVVGRASVITAETLRAAEGHAEMLLAALGATRRSGETP
ncbi:hypothetical protein [Cryptosporangium japonicum]|uniref:Uncharacterized protein n=1 Tax=Cryptosporangium japonicum TaxID=80872 RepID=A0ABN0UY02_9ACTN